MSSIRRIDALRANGARSRGPVTESGKQISSQNARRHALLARIVVLENESQGGFAEVLAAHVGRFQPAGDVEYGIIEEMVAAWWRMRRAWSIETQLFTERLNVPNPGDGTSLLAAAFKNVDDSRGLALLHRYETRLHCMYQRGIRNLQLLRNEEAPKENGWPGGLPAPGDENGGPGAAPPEHAVPNEPTKSLKTQEPPAQPPQPMVQASSRRHRPSRRVFSSVRVPRGSSVAISPASVEKRKISK